jgi:phosphoribosyl 1,2-cyclic phosphate phosphodiesterase
MIGCHCEVCTSTDPHDQRTRPSVVITYGNTRVLIDTTPELRLQAVANHVDKIDAIVFTHCHADHVMGLDDVRRFNAIAGGPLDAWGDEATHAGLTTMFGYAFREPDPDVKVFRPYLRRRIIQGRFEIGGVTWTPVTLYHGEMPVLGFRVGNLAYCTDVSRIPNESLGLLEGLDVLVLDALQYRPHSTHFSLDQAVEATRRIRPKQALFTHIAHALKHEVVNAALPDGMRLAHDGQRVRASMS